MSETINHSDTPWSVRPREGDGCDYVVPAASGARVAADATKADAERIVGCVNAHDELVAALELARLWLLNCIPVVHLDGPKPMPVIYAALARAEGK